MSEVYFYPSINYMTAGVTEDLNDMTVKVAHNEGSGSGSSVSLWGQLEAMGKAAATRYQVTSGPNDRIGFVGCDKAPGYNPDAEVSSDAETSDACIRTCEPGPCSDTLHVPSDYPTIQNAMANAQMGDIVQVAPGTHEVDEPIFMADCTHLVGGGIGTTEIKRTFKNDGWDCTCQPYCDYDDTFIFMAEGSSIKEMDVRGYYNDNIGNGAYLGCNILADSVSASVMNTSHRGTYGVAVQGDANVQITSNYFLGGYLAVPGDSVKENGILFRDNSSGNVVGNIFDDSKGGTGIEILDNSSPKIRSNNFVSQWVSISVFGSELGTGPNPDIGTERDPGLNIFDWPHYDNPHNRLHGYIWLMKGYDMDVSFRGNCFENKTYNEMMQYPFESSNIKTIWDGRGGDTYNETGNGVADYRGFRSIEDCWIGF